MKNKRIIQRIDERYVGEDCIQKMVAYKDFLAIFGNGEELYFDFQNYGLIHTYLEDERRKYFPYSNIPTHIKTILFKKYKVANQLLNFDTPYFIFSKELTSTLYAIRDGASALLVIDFFPSLKVEENYVTREELEDLFASSEDELKCFYQNGKWSNSLKVPTQEKIMYQFKNHMKKYIETQDMKNYYKNILTLMVEDASPKYITEDFPFCIDDIFMLKSKGKELSISFVSIRFVSEDCYKIIQKVAPVNHYTLEQIKGMNEKVINATEPKIKLSLNPNLTKEDIIEGAKLERILKQ